MCAKISAKLESAGMGEHLSTSYLQALFMASSQQSDEFSALANSFIVRGLDHRRRDKSCSNLVLPL